jgi:hypothetical protein
MATAQVTSPLETFRARIEATGRECIEQANGWIKTSCPCGYNHKNGDAHPSLGFREIVNDTDDTDRTVAIHCFCECPRKEILDALGMRERDLYSSPDGKGLASFLQHTEKAKQALTLNEYSHYTLLPLDFLMIQLGLYEGVFTFHRTDATPYKLKGVAMPYWRPDGTLFEKVKLRTALKKTGKLSHFVWSEGDEDLIAYGLEVLFEAKKAGFLIIVEGESDWQTLRYHGYYAIGIPGTGNVKKTLDASIVEGIPKVYIIQEKTDQAGMNFPFNVQRHLRECNYTGEILRVPLKTLTGAKDPNDLHKRLWDKDKPRDHDRFREAFQKALDQAKPMNYDTGSEQDDSQFNEIRGKVIDAIEKEDTKALYDLAEEIAFLPLKQKELLTDLIKRSKTFSLSAFNKLIREAEKARRAEEIAARDAFPEYERKDTGMVYNSPMHGPVALSNFTAEIVADTKVDDGVEQTRFYALQAKLLGRYFSFEVPAKDFPKCDWIDLELGARARASAGNSIKAHLTNAIKDCSDPDELLHYAHTGWREIDDAIVFLHNGGCIGHVGQKRLGRFEDLTNTFFSSASACRATLERERESNGHIGHIGQVNIQASVKLTGPLVNFDLTCEKENLQQAIQASLRILDLAPDVVTAPLYSAIWRSPLGDVDFGVHLVGKTGWGKTELAALAQQHYGASMSAKKLPGSWESTENSLEMALFQIKDALMTLDDFKPKGGKGDQARLHAKADRIFRSIGNGATRGRLDANLKQRPERRPRCLVVSTGEDVPQGQSLKGRLIVLTMEERVTVGESAKKLREAQMDAREGFYVQAMAGYIEWLAPRIEAIQAQITELAAIERDRLCIEGHARSSTNTANLLLGMKCFLQYACEMGAIMPQEAQTYLERCQSALIQIAGEAAREDSQDNPSEQWKRLIIAAISSNKAHLTNPEDEGCPGHEYGWIKSIRNIERDGESVPEETFHPGGDHLGWIVGDDIYLLPEVAYKVASSMGNSIGNNITTSERLLKKFLAQDKVLASTSLGTSRGSVTIRKLLRKGFRLEVLHIKKETLFPDDIPTNFSDQYDQPDQEPSESASEDAAGSGQVNDQNPEWSSNQSDHDSTNIPNEDMSAIPQEYRDLLVRYQQKVFSLKSDTPLWTAPDSGYKNTMFGKNEHIMRTKSLLRSGELNKIKAALEAMKRTLGEYQEDRRGA